MKFIQVTNKLQKYKLIYISLQTSIHTLKQRESWGKNGQPLQRDMPCANENVQVSVLRKWLL